MLEIDRLERAVNLPDGAQEGVESTVFTSVLTKSSPLNSKGSFSVFANA